VGRCLAKLQVKRAPLCSAALAVAVGVLALAAPSARAEPNARTVGDVGVQLDVALNGHIVQRCEIRGGESIDLGELRGGLTAAADFGLDCNVPFDIQVVSTRGGLAHASQPLGEGPYSGTLPYDLNVTVPTLYPEREVIVRASFLSSNMIGRAVLSSGDGIASGRGSLELRTREPAGAGLLAGRYTETLTMTIIPRV